MLQVKLLCLCSMCGSSSITAVQSLCALDEVCQALWGVLLHFYDLWWSPEVLPHKARGGQLVSVDTDGFNMQTSWNQPYFRKLCLKPPGVCSPFFIFSLGLSLSLCLSMWQLHFIEKCWWNTKAVIVHQRLRKSWDIIKIYVDVVFIEDQSQLSIAWN